MKIGQAAAAIIGQAIKTGSSAATQRTTTASASTLANASSRTSKPAAEGSAVRHNIPPASQGDIFSSVARHFSAKAAGGSVLQGLTQTLAKLGDTPKPEAIQLLSEGKNWSEMTKKVIDAMNTTMPQTAKPGLDSTVRTA